jgi:hypothetical protein
MNHGSSILIAGIAVFSNIKLYFNENKDIRNLFYVLFFFVASCSTTKKNKSKLNLHIFLQL